MTGANEEAAAPVGAQVEDRAGDSNAVRVDAPKGTESNRTASEGPILGDDADVGGEAPGAMAANGEGPAAAVEGPKDGPPAPTPEEIARDARIGRARGVLARALQEFRPFHSGFQIDRFIVGMNGPTPWGAFVQVAREVNTRVEALKLDYVAAGRLQLDREEAIEAAEVAAKAFGMAVEKGAKTFRAIADDGEREQKLAHQVRKERRALKRAELARSEAIFKLDAVRRTIADRERELGRFLGHFEALREQLEAEGPLTPERREELEAGLWFEKVKLAIATEVSGLGGITAETLQLLNALDRGPREELLGFSQQDPNDLQRWLLSRRAIAAPELALPPVEVRTLLCS